MYLPREIALLGKGPSLDSYEHEIYTVGVNETAYLKQCDAAIAIDYPVLKKYMEHITDQLVFRKCTHISYEFKNMFLIDYKIHAPIPKLRTGTASIFIQLAGYLGVRTIHFWGFDAITGNGDYANSIIQNKVQGVSKDKYKKISYNIVTALRETNIQPIWRHI